jgi:predicted DNA-binding transcriptional regulator YafY
MPYNKDAYSRYKIIDQRLRNKRIPPASLEDLMDFVSEKLGKTVSKRTIQNDIQAMRQDENLGFLAPIVYNHAEKVYQYSQDDYSIERVNLSEEDLQGIETALGILEQFKSVPSIKYFEEAISSMASNIKMNRDAVKDSVFLLDRPNKYLGAQFMPTIVDAIRDKRVLHLEYKSFTKDTAKKHKIHPYFIKEYNERLYLIANDIAAGKAPKFLTFSFDRMLSISDTYDSFKAEYVDKGNYFKNALGVSFVDAKPVEVVLTFPPSQGAYLKTQFIHHTQQVVKDTDKEFTISLQLVINPELKMKILSYGKNVEVISPVELKEFVVENAQEMLILYKKEEKRKKK